MQSMQEVRKGKKKLPEKYTLTTCDFIFLPRTSSKSRSITPANNDLGVSFKGFTSFFSPMVCEVLVGQLQVLVPSGKTYSTKCQPVVTILLETENHDALP